jgi:hypothetical protein
MKKNVAEEGLGEIMIERRFEEEDVKGKEGRERRQRAVSMTSKRGSRMRSFADPE